LTAAHKVLAGTLLVAALAVAVRDAAADTDIGPSTRTAPYLVPTHTGVRTRSILTVGDSIRGYRMAGIPDGLGAFDNGDGTFTLLVNHELGDTAGTTRRHGAKGAFVSRWIVRASDLRVLSGEDLTRGPNDVHTYDKASSKYSAGAAAWNRFCSADLAPISAFHYRSAGTRDRIFLTGEETTPRFSPDHGRAFAYIATGAAAGQAWELPRLGRMAFENVVASPHAQPKTLVFGLDDANASTGFTDPKQVCGIGFPLGCVTPPSELYLYVGTKEVRGNPIERAGLANGVLLGIRVEVNGKPVIGEDKDYVFGSSSTGRITRARFEMHDFGDVSGRSGNDLQAASIRAGVTQFIRIEDGAWDPRAERRKDFYFVTSGNFSRSNYRPSRLWRMRFDDIERPEAGGTIEALLDSADPVSKPGFEMLDNIAIDRRGRIVMLEDVGANERLSKVWLYDTDSGKLHAVAEHNPRFFKPGAPEFLTRDKESSGVIDAAPILGEGWFLLDVQAHYDIGDPELVQGGQLLALYISPSLGSITTAPASARSPAASSRASARRARRSAN